MATLGFCCVCALVPGCQEDSGVSGDPALYAGQDEASAEIGPEGGQFLVGNCLRVGIPPGALAEPLKVRVTRAGIGELAAAEPSLRRVGQVLRAEPHGREFADTIQVDLRVEDEAAPASSLRILRLDDDRDGQWEEVASVRVLEPEEAAELQELSEDERILRTSRRIRAEVTGFSLYTVVAMDEPAL